MVEQNLYYQDFKPKSEKEYLKLFRKATTKHKIIGEASVSYLYYPEVSKRIHSFNSKSKIVILLRDPVERAWSHYLMDKRLGLVKKELIEIFKSTENKDKLNFQQYFLVGKYTSQIEKYLELFGKENVKIFYTKELKNNRDKIISELYEFLGIKNLNIIKETNHNFTKNQKELF